MGETKKGFTRRFYKKSINPISSVSQIFSFNSSSSNKLEFLESNIIRWEKLLKGGLYKKRK